jgi:hypothetical protein
MVSVDRGDALEPGTKLVVGEPFVGLLGVRIPGFFRVLVQRDIIRVWDPRPGFCELVRLLGITLIQ